MSNVQQHEPGQSVPAYISFRCSHELKGRLTIIRVAARLTMQQVCIEALTEYCDRVDSLQAPSVRELKGTKAEGKE